MPVPNTFANATATIPLSQLDANFATTITLGNTAIQLGNTVSTLNNMTLANVTVSSGNVTITNVTVTTANVTTANIATAQIANVTVSGTGTFAAGSNTAPSITTSGDTNTGIFFPAADTIAFTEGGVESMRIDSAGNVGIGTTSPSFISGYGGLQINGGGNGSVVHLTNSTTGTTSTDGFDLIVAQGSSDAYVWQRENAPLIFGTNATERLRLDSSGNLGLGVTPSAWQSYLAFQMNAGSLISFSTTDYRMVQNTVRSSGSWRYVNNGPAASYLQDGVAGGHAWFTAPSGTAGNAITFTQAMTLDASGNLGIGTSSPNNKLVVNGAIAAAGEAAAAISNGCLIDQTAGFLTRILNYSSTTGSAIAFYTGSAGTTTERMRIDASGNVGIGTSSPSTYAGKLTVLDGYITAAQSTNNSYINWYSGGAALNQKYWRIGTGGGALVFETVNDAYTTPTERARITSAGEFWVAGTTDQGAYNIQCNGTGVWGAGAYVNGSDARIKEDIAPITSSLDIVTKLNPVTYRYKENWSKDQSIQTGFIAQELLVAMEGQNYVDGIVQQGGSEGYYSVAYQNIIPLLTKAIQEQQAMIDELKAKVAALENA